MFDFYDDWDDSGDDDLFGKRTGGSKVGEVRQNVSGDGMDEEDRRFFEELSKGFSTREENDNDLDSGKPMERNELMDNTKATRQMLAAHR